MPPPPRACVFGHKVAHSRSPLIHNHWLRTLEIPGSYSAIDVAPDAFPATLATLAAEGFVGGNVTLPLKEIAHRSVTRLDAAAAAIGAVNTLWFEAGTLIGGNTDSAGFLASLDDALPGWEAEAAIVLGAGGAARAILHGLHHRGLAALRIVNRDKRRAAELASHVHGATAHDWTDLPDLLPTADLLVNTTPLGMTGNPPLPIDLGPLEPTAIVTDIVYSPLETALLRAARDRQLRTVDGLGMLLHQAVPGFARWFGHTPRVTAELRALVEADLRT